MTNEDWYYANLENLCYKLTDKAPPEAVKSYEEFYKYLDSQTVIELPPPREKH